MPERVPPAAQAEQVTLPEPAIGTTAEATITPLQPAAVPTQPALVQPPAPAAGPEAALRARLTPEEQAKLDRLRQTPEHVAAFTAETPAAPVGTLTTEKAAPPPAAQPVAAAPVVGAPKAVEPVSLPGAKGEVIKLKAKTRKAARQAPAEAKAEEAPSAPAEAERAPAAAPEAEAAPRGLRRTNLSRDAAKSARDVPALQSSPVYHLDEFPETLRTSPPRWWRGTAARESRGIATRDHRAEPRGNRRRGGEAAGGTPERGQGGRRGTVRTGRARGGGGSHQPQGAPGQGEEGRGGSRGQTCPRGRQGAGEETCRQGGRRQAAGGHPGRERRRHHAGGEQGAEETRGGARSDPDGVAGRAPEAGAAAEEPDAGEEAGRRGEARRACRQEKTTAGPSGPRRSRR